MAPRTRFIKHVFGGGWATDYGPTASVPVPESGKVELPWLNTADNVIYELDGGPHKCPGCSLNTSALESGADIMGVYDAIFTGVAGSVSQRRILHVGSKIKNDNSDDTFLDLFTGMTVGAVPCYTMFEDLLIMSNDSGVDVPKSWNLTTAQNLAGTPPNFAFSVVHKNRCWAAGVAAAPSSLYYSASLNGADWVGAGSGTIEIDPADGDEITGLVSFNDELWIFKGPYKGSIHRITGSSPTGDDAFARKPFRRGVGAANHASIVQFRNDIAFMWIDGSIRTLNTTANFGDYEQASLTREIGQWIRDHVNLSSLRFVQAVDWPAYNCILIALPIDGSASCNIVLMMDYRFDPPRFSPWTSFNMITSLAQGVSPSASRQHTILAGGTDGKLRTLAFASRTIDTDTSISFNVATPYLDYDLPQRKKTLEAASVTLNPKSTTNFTFAWNVDGGTEQTVSLAQGGGVALGSFVLGTSTLGGGRFKEVFTRLDEQGGEFRAVQYRIADNAPGIDIELHSIGAAITTGAESLES